MEQMNHVTLSHTVQHQFKSETIGDLFNINIALPKNYSPETRQYPVAYLTDANIFFGMVAETAWLLQYGQEIPEVIIVAIGYPDNSEHMALRERDLTPTQEGNAKNSGGSGDFLKFISKELKPFIESSYSVNTKDSALLGDSMGGLFGLYVLFNQPEEFQRYIIGSPSIYWDNSVILSMEQLYSEKNDTLPAKVFLSAGELEALYEPAFAGMLSNVAKLTETLSFRKYKKLIFESHIFKNETHLSVIPATFSRGLREIYKTDYSLLNS